MYFARLSENFMSVFDKYFHFVFTIPGNTSSDFLQKLQMSGEVFSPPEPSRAKFTPSGRVFRLSRPLAWTLYLVISLLVLTAGWDLIVSVPDHCLHFYFMP